MAEEKRSAVEFVDFLPDERIGDNSWFIFNSYQTLSDLFTKINLWLEAHLEWQIKTCESILYDPTDGFGQRIPDHTGPLARKCLRGIRCWLCRRPEVVTVKRAQKIGCFNLVPKINRDAFTDQQKSIPSESIPALLQRANETLKFRPIEGKVLSMETVLISLDESYNIDAENCVYVRDSQYHCQIIRIYFEKGASVREEICIQDFYPVPESWNSPLAPPMVEPFTKLLLKGSQWLQMQTNVRFLGCQAVEIPISKDSAVFGLGEKQHETLIDTENCEYLIKFVRICYSKISPGSISFRKSNVAISAGNCADGDRLTESDDFVLNCKIFAPMRDNKVEIYESLASIKRKLDAWLRITGAKMLYAETAMVKLSYLNSSLMANVDSCLTSTEEFSHAQWITIIRIYLNGYYQDPPVSVLASAMAINESSTSIGQPRSLAPLYTGPPCSVC